jgi:hypothetical protein
MRMAMVDVRVVRVLMSQYLVPMRMHMWLDAPPRERMIMLVMLVMAMRMAVLDRVVRMNMLVPLSKVQPYAQAHERCGCPEENPGWLRPQQEGDHDPE